MLAHSPKARSRSPHRTNGNPPESTSQNDLNNHDVNPTNHNHKSKKENDSQLRMKSLKVRTNILLDLNPLTSIFLFSQAFLQTMINDLSTLGSTSEEQIKALENACVKEFRDLSLDRIRRVIRSVFKVFFCLLISLIYRWIFLGSFE